MSFKELKKLFKDTPDIIKSNIKMNSPNKPISIYKGFFELHQKDLAIEINGEICFEWIPRMGAKFTGDIISSSKTLVTGVSGLQNFTLRINELEVGLSYIMSQTGTYVEGILTSTVVLGDKSIPVKKVKFSIPNLMDFLGKTVKNITPKKISESKSRLIFDSDKFTITIDKSAKYKEFYHLLEKKGGYLNLYHGELISKKSAIKFEDLNEILYCFSNFISFLNGRRCSAIFSQGMHEDQIIWSDYSNYFVDEYKYAPSWVPKHSFETIDDLNKLWQNFYKLWLVKDNRHFLYSLIHWYVEANNNSGFAEGSIVMSQVAHELIYNWLLIESKKLLQGKDAENISASNKIRLLLSTLKVNYDIPIHFVALKNFAKVNKCSDGPEAFVYVRNSIVHSQETKRKALSDMSHQAKYEALFLGIWYIELSLLFILNHQGHYINRCSDKIYIPARKEIVPWA